MSDLIQRGKGAIKRIAREDEMQGYMGKPDGAGGWTYAVPHHPGYVYVRVIVGTQISIAEAVNQGAAENPNILVEIVRKNGILIVRRPDAASAAHVLGVDVNDALLGGGGSTPITSGFSYVGYNTVGGSQEAIAANGQTTRFKAITITDTGLLVSIGMYLTGTQTFPNGTRLGLQVLVMSDDSGDPAELIAMGPNTITHVFNTVGRWVDLPIVKLLTPGDYWLAFRGTGSAATEYIHYDSGSDPSKDAGTASTMDFPPYTVPSSSGNKYSIRGGILR